METNDTPNEPTPVHQPGVPSQMPWLSGYGVDPSVLRMIVAIVVTGAAMAIAGEVGALLSTFGLAGIALAVAIVLVVAGVFVRRQAMLPLALVAASLTLPAAVVALGEHRLDRSAGLLTVRPKTPGDLGNGHFRRGRGVVFLDLRSMTPTPGQVLRISARADAGRVVVALPRDRCYNLDVRSRLAPRPTAVGRQALALAGMRPHVDRYYASDMFGAPDSQVLRGASGGALMAFGRSTGLQRDVSWKRTAAAKDAPSLVLDLVGTDAAIVRDFPMWIGPLQDAFPGEQVGGEAWPVGVALPLNPGEVKWDDRWRATWSKAERARGLPEKWQKWERDVIVAAKQQAIRAAGACAPQDELARSWAQASYDAGSASAAGFAPRMIAVNGLGTVKRWTWNQQSGALEPSTATVLDRGAR